MTPPVPTLLHIAAWRQQRMGKISPGSLYEKVQDWDYRDLRCCYLNCTFCHCHDFRGLPLPHMQRTVSLICPNHKSNKYALFRSSLTHMLGVTHSYKTLRPHFLCFPFDAVQVLTQSLDLLGENHKNLLQLPASPPCPHVTIAMRWGFVFLCPIYSARAVLFCQVVWFSSMLYVNCSVFNSNHAKMYNQQYIL